MIEIIIVTIIYSKNDYVIQLLFVDELVDEITYPLFTNIQDCDIFK